MDWPLKTSLLAGTLAAGLWLSLPGPPLFAGRPLSRMVYDSRGRFVSLTPASDGRYRLWTPLSEISPLLVEATRLREEPERASVRSMAWPLARLESPAGWRLRARAVALGLRYTPEELLEAYLNRAGYGPGIEGAGAASLLYFGKNPDQLSLSEALTLSVMPDNPVRPVLGGGNPADLKRRQSARLRAGRRWQRAHPGERQAAAPGPAVGEAAQASIN